MHGIGPTFRTSRSSKLRLNPAATPVGCKFGSPRKIAERLSDVKMCIADTNVLIDFLPADAVAGSEKQGMLADFLIGALSAFSA